MFLVKLNGFRVGSHEYIHSSGTTVPKKISSNATKHVREAEIH
jgi:hypothetical protein